MVGHVFILHETPPQCLAAIGYNNTPILFVKGGGGEIRTLDQVSPMPPFQGGALDHYATPPASGPCRGPVLYRYIRKMLLPQRGLIEVLLNQATLLRDPESADE